MTDPRPFRLMDLILLVLILAAAGGARAWYLHQYADDGHGQGPLQVQEHRAADPAQDRRQTEQDTEVKYLFDEQRFKARAPFATQDEETAHTAPGYVYLLFLADRASDTPAYLVRWIQCGLGALTAGLYFLFARRAFASRFVAILAGLLCAAHPFWVVNTAEIDDGVLAAFLLSVAVWSGARAGQTGGAFTSLLFGLTLAGLALVRAPLLPFALVALLWFCLRCRVLTRGWLCALLAFLGMANGLAPWCVRNAQVFHDAFPIVDSTYLHLWIGNNPRATGGPLDEKTQLEALIQQQDGKGDPRVKAEELAQLPQRDRYQQFGELVLKEIKADPGRTVQRRLWALLCFFFGDEWLRFSLTGRDPWSEATSVDLPLTAIFNGTLLAMLLLGGLGWRWSYAWRWSSMPAALAVVWVPLPYILSHGEALFGPRLPLDGVLLCYVAFALVGLVPGIGRNLREGLVAGKRSDE